MKGNVNLECEGKCEDGECEGECEGGCEEGEEGECEDPCSLGQDVPFWMFKVPTQSRMYSKLLQGSWAAVASQHLSDD